MRERFSFFAAPPDAARQKEIYRYFEKEHPALFCGVCGRSVLGTPLRFFSVGQGARTVLYIGTHHGMEWLTALLLFRFLDDLAVAAERRGLSDPLPPGVRLLVLPLLNPDGVEIALHGAEGGGILAPRLREIRPDGDFCTWQANARGVDLNHNYDAGFAAYREREREAGIFGPAPTRYSGEYPFSEPETAAVYRLLQIFSPALTLTLHTQGEEIYYHPVTPPVPHAAEIGATLARLTGYRLGEAEGLAAYGGMSDYLAEKCRLPAFTLECGLGKNPLPIAQGKTIYRRLRRVLFLSLALAGKEGDGDGTLFG